MDDKFCWPCSQKEVTKLPPCPLQCKSPNCPSFKKPPDVDLSQKFFLWVMGAQGSGRSSQCQKIAQKYRFHQISPSQLLKKESQSETVRGNCVLSILEREEVAPNDLMMELIKPIIDEQALMQPNSPPGYVINGFPREERQGLWFERTIAPVNLIERKHVLYRHHGT
ncbi:adenylate kinase isoenzyme 1-like [Pectinophora gossypiella]|uniref:adenylate kinase isoenzyme 1-like n=1 Tax=Pectinophora gossypiella TaxID=13191 RepID=UPI00214EE5D0|nr:adenylate kinase isoenzyme 1-like [Pectinophora gossypiella]